MRALFLLITIGLFSIGSQAQDSLRKDSARLLKAVTVTAKRPLLEYGIDRTTVNVASMISSSTSNTLEVLEKTPGITVSPTGEISLNGRPGVAILIDGRTNYLAGTDLLNYLRSLPGSVLDKIELMDNPPARYDANGGAIINIRLKKNRTAGFTSNINLGYTQGRYARHNESLSFSYRQGKTNLYGNFSNYNEQDYNLNTYQRRFFDAEGKQEAAIHLTNNHLQRLPALNGMLGMDYQLSKKFVAGWQVNGYSSHRKSELFSNSRSNDSQGKPDSTSVGYNNGWENRKNLEFNANAQYSFNTSGREISADINYIRHDGNGLQQINNELFTADGLPVENQQFFYDLSSNTGIFTVKADYVHPLKGKGKIETGFKSGFVNNDHGLETDFHQNSNRFLYKEQVHAAYATYQQSWKRFGWQLGLRVEHTHATGNQLGNQYVAAEKFTKNYTQLFPTAFFNYKLDSTGKDQLTLIISRRINRPNYQALNPFLFFRDQYSYTTGNPELTPQFQLRYELKYQRKQWLNLGLSYNRFTDVIFSITSAEGKTYISRSENLANGFMLLLNANISWSPVKWWNMNNYIQLSRMGLNGNTDKVPLQTRASVLRYTWNNQFSCKKGWAAEFGAYFASKDLNGQAYTAARIRAQAAIQKKILKEKGSIRLGFDDIFHSWIQRNHSVGLYRSEFNQVFETDTQRLGLAFTYRFGKEGFARKRKYNNNSADEEKGRID